MADLEFSGKTVEDAIKDGLGKMGIEREQADITVLDEGGLFGFKKAKVKISKKLTDGERALAFIEKLLVKMNFDCQAELVSEGEKIIINLISSHSASIIGYRGEVLDSFQCLAGAVANTGREEYKRVVVDCENYRAKREDTLKNLAKKLAEKAVRTARKVQLEPMNPFERRVIHSALSEVEDVTTISEGREPSRYITIIPKNERKFIPRNYGDRPFDQRRQDGRRPFNRDRNDSGFNRDRNDFNKDSGARTSERPERTERNERNERTERPMRRDDSSRPQNSRPRNQEVSFGTYLGNSNTDKTEKTDK